MSAPYASTFIGAWSLLIVALLHTASTVASSNGLPDASVFGCLDMLMPGPPVDRAPARGCCGAPAGVHRSVQNVTVMLTAMLFEPRRGHSVQKNRRLRVTPDTALARAAEHPRPHPRSPKTSPASGASTTRESNRSCRANTPATSGAEPLAPLVKPRCKKHVAHGLPAGHSRMTYNHHRGTIQGPLEAVWRKCGIVRMLCWKQAHRTELKLCKWCIMKVLWLR